VEQTLMFLFVLYWIWIEVTERD